MQHPPIQIVDKDDKPIGGVGMMEAYKKGLIHRIVFIWVLDEHGKALLQKRSAKVETFPNCWDVSAAGHVDEGEDYVDAAKRELKEEVGIDGVKLQEVNSFYHEITVNNMLLKRFNKVYRTVIPASVSIKPNPEEVAEIKWLEPQAIRDFATQYPDEVAGGLFYSLDQL